MKFGERFPPKAPSSAEITEMEPLIVYANFKDRNVSSKSD